MTSHHFENIVAWQRAHESVLAVYQITKHFPEDEKFGLTSQFRRAAVSIEANIAEGYKKLSKADKLRFPNIPEGSLEECRDDVVLSRDLGHTTQEETERHAQCIEQASKLPVAYCKGIISNNAMRDRTVREDSDTSELPYSCNASTPLTPDI